MAVLRRLKQALTVIGALTVAAGLALVGLAIYVWWDTRDAGTQDFDDDFETETDFDDDFEADFETETEDEATEDIEEDESEPDVDVEPGENGAETEDEAAAGEASDD